MPLERSRADEPVDHDPLWNSKRIERQREFEETKLGVIYFVFGRSYPGQFSLESSSLTDEQLSAANDPQRSTLSWGSNLSALACLVAVRSSSASVITH